MALFVHIAVISGRFTLSGILIHKAKNRHCFIRQILQACGRHVIGKGNQGIKSLAPVFNRLLIFQPPGVYQLLAVAADIAFAPPKEVLDALWPHKELHPPQPPSINGRQRAAVAPVKQVNPKRHGSLRKLAVCRQIGLPFDESLQLRKKVHEAPQAAAVCKRRSSTISSRVSSS